MFDTFTLKNGLKVATYQMTGLKSINLQIAVKGGSLLEDKQNNGVAHLMEHMLVQGTKSYPSVEDFSLFVESLAGSYGAQTEKMQIGFHITLPFTKLEEAVKLSSEVFFEPLFVNQPDLTQAAFEKERQVVITEISQKKDSHWHKIIKFLRSTRFRSNHSLTLETGGNPEIVKNLTQEELKKYWQLMFMPANTYLLVIGNFQTKELKDNLEKYFESYPNQTKFEGFPSMSNKDFSAKGVHIRKDSTLSTEYLDITFPSLNLEAPLEKRLTQGLIFIIFGRLRNSRLFKLLRYQKGLVYDVGIGSSQLPQLGYITISSEIPLNSVDEVIGLIIQELNLLTNEGVTTEELAFAKNYLANQWLMTFDHPGSIMGWMEGGLLWEDKIRLPEDYIKLIEKINTQDILQLMKDYWDLSKLNLTLQGPIKSSPENKEKYQAFIEKLDVRD